MRDAPLAGLHVVECASFVAGPSAGLALAQLGADVVRVDPLGGANDVHRWPVAGNGESYYWSALNAGKRSVQLDLGGERGRELLAALATAPGADRGILVDNVVGRPWLSDEALRARRDDLIHVRVQGRPSGAPAVDYTVNAEVGVPALTGPAGAAAPVNHVLPAWDLLTGLQVVAAVLSALRRRDAGGAGAFVEVALADVALAGVANLGWLSEVAERGRDRPADGNHLYGSYGSDFACADGRRVMVVALTRGQWRALAAATGTAAAFAAISAALDVDLDDEAARYRLREVITAVLRPWFAARPFDEVAAALDAGHVLWGAYRPLSGVVAAHRAGPAGVLGDVTLPGGAAGIAARSPARWDGGYGELPRPVALGAHTAEVLTEVLGLSAGELGALAAGGVIPG